MESRLETLALNAARTSGVEHMVMIGHIRIYLRANTDYDIIDDIMGIVNTDALKPLIEAGLEAPYLEALLERWKKK